MTEQAAAAALQKIWALLACRELFNGFAAGDEMIANARYRAARPHDVLCAEPNVLAHGPFCGAATGVITLCDSFFDPGVEEGYRLWTMIHEALHLAGASHQTPASPGADRFPLITGTCQVWN